MVSTEPMHYVWDVPNQWLQLQEPSCNPAMEAQEIDCLYGLGQVKPVSLYRYYVHKTLEMNIHQVQRRKGELELYVFLHHQGFECGKKRIDQGLRWAFIYGYLG